MQAMALPTATGRCVLPSRHRVCQASRPSMLVLPSSGILGAKFASLQRTDSSRDVRMHAETYARDVSSKPRLIQHKTEAFW